MFLALKARLFKENFICKMWPGSYGRLMMRYAMHFVSTESAIYCKI